MPTKKELFNQLKIDLAKGQGEHMVHLVDHAEERERRAINPNRSTKMFINCYSTEGWRLMQMQKDRYFTIGVDPHIAVDLMIRALAAFNDATLRGWVDQGHQAPEGAPPGPPKAELPEWMK